MDPSISGRGAEPVYRDKLKGPECQLHLICDFVQIFQCPWAKHAHI